MKHATLLLFIAILAVGSRVVAAQNLLDNEYYRQSQQLQQESETALNNGDYALAIERARQSREFADLAYERAELLYFAYVARAAKIRAESALDLVDRSTISYDEQQQIVIEDSRAFYRDGIMLFDEEEYELSALSFLNVIAILDAAGIPTGRELPVAQSTDSDRQGAAAPLPRYYRVRLIPEDRDSFSKISAYPFVYGDYREWPRLYEMNKDKIVDSENPNLIHPGQLFEIPALTDEVREGEWEPPASSQ